MSATFASYLATGKGLTAFRLVIEGCSRIFVTDEAMECTMDDGRKVVRGLQYDSISVGESVYMAGAELNIQLSSLQISETDGPQRDAATLAFTGWGAGSVKTYLAPDTSVDVGDTTASVRSAAGLSVNDVVHIGTEAWLITGIETHEGSTPDVLTITRHLWSTTEQAFPATYTGAMGTAPTAYEITSEPATLRGRRVWLYGHGADELTLDTANAGAGGTIVFRGILSEAPELVDSCTWSLSMQPRTALLEANIGQANGGSIGMRGIYYPGRAPLTIEVDNHTGDTDSSAMGDRSIVRLVGFYETQAAFCTALQALLEPELTSGRVTVTEQPNGTWRIGYTPDAGSPLFVGFRTLDGGAVDGWMTGTLANVSGTDSVRQVFSGFEYWVPYAGDSGIGYSGVPQEAVRRVPRGNYHIAHVYRGSDANIAAYPHTRFYLTAVAGFTTGRMVLTPPKVHDSDPDPTPLDLPIGTVSGLGYVDIGSAEGWRIDSVDMGGLSGFSFSGDIEPTIEISVRHGSTSGCNLAAFMDAVLAESPNSCNLGTIPWLTDDDVADWTSEVLAASAGHPWLELRDYTFAKPRKLIEILREECKLYGLYMTLDSTGRIAVKRYPKDLSPSVTALGADEHTPGDDFGSVKISPDGVLTDVKLKLGYIPADDKWATEWSFDRPNGAATSKIKGGSLEITPFVRATSSNASDNLTPADAELIVQTILGWFGAQYYVVTVSVAITMHSLRVGDTVLVTIPQLPKGGARGSTTSGSGLFSTRATVIGRHWDYASGGGTLDLFVHGLDLAGYAPSCAVASASGAGTAWTLTCSAAAYGPGSVADASFFATGFKVVLREFDSDAPERITGTVTSVAGNAISVTLDSSWSGVGSKTWILGFGAAQVVTTAQRVYAFLADQRGRIQYSDASAQARVFS